ncbi:MAG: ABC transporter permease [Acidobacteria bacterium]|nr:ABC transporter permease [Acidobacteriota bacterium]
MLKLIFHRFFQGVFILLIISMLVFALLASTGGDAVSALQTNSQTSEETLATLRHIYGLDRSLPVRYASWLSALFRGNLGQSLYFQTSVGNILLSRLSRTAELAVCALFIALLFAFTLGLAAAHRVGSWADRICNAIILFAASTPRLVLAILGLSITARTTLFKLAVATNSTIDSSYGTWLLRLLPPALILAVPLIAVLLAQTRTAVAATLETEFVRTARAKGLSERIILQRHALRPALNPLITTVGYSIGGLMSGSVIVEQVMNWPGLGQLSVIAVQSRDVALLMGIVLVTSAAVLIGNLAADILLRLNDPRLR